MATSVGKRLAQLLASGGVTAVFGVPGGQTLPLYAGIDETEGIEHVLMRDERNAACAADAYARISGRIGVCDATVGPGATNLVSGLAEAFSSSIPVLALVADIRSDRSHLRRRGVVSQAIDQTALLTPVSKWVGRVDRTESLEAVIEHGVRVATSGRPGPVCIEIPDDVFRDSLSETNGVTPHTAGSMTYPRFRNAPLQEDVAEAVRLIGQAKRPLILAGGGVTFSGAIEAVGSLAERHNLPVATTINGKGCIAEHSPLSAGVTGMFGSRRANAAVMSADTILVIGSKLTQTATHNWRSPGPHQTLIHVDIDGEEIGRTMPVALGICADAREVAKALDAALRATGGRQNWLADLPHAPASAEREHEPGIAPERIAQVISDALGPDDILVCDASLASGWGAANVRLRRSGRHFIAPRGLAGIGWAGGAAIGARTAAHSGQRVVVLAGDGGWSYALGEVETACRNGANLTYVVLNNSALGWIKHIQDRSHWKPSLYSDVDFAAVAAGMGAGASRVTNIEDFEAEFHRGLEQPGPFLVDAVSSLNASPIISIEQVSDGAYT